MNRQPVHSSNLQSVGYDAEARTLELEFSNGRVYQYLGVPPFVYETLMGASSKGKYFFSAVRGQYTEREVTAEGTTPALTDAQIDELIREAKQKPTGD